MTKLEKDRAAKKAARLLTDLDKLVQDTTGEKELPYLFKNGLYTARSWLTLAVQTYENANRAKKQIPPIDNL